MSNCLRIGDRQLNGDQIITALVQYKLLDALIGNVLLDEAIQAIEVSQQDAFQLMTGTSEGFVPEHFEDYLTQWCESRNITPAYFKSVVLREWRIEKFKQYYFAQHLESEFLQTKSYFDQVEYSLIQVENAALAQEIYYQLRDDGSEFADLAAAYSLGYERNTGGRVGPVPFASLPGSVQAVVKDKQLGMVQSPIQVDDRYWVIRLELLMNVGFTEATRAELMNRLFDQWLQAKVNALTAIPGAIAVQPENDYEHGVEP